MNPDITLDEANMKQPPTQKQMDNPGREQPGTPNYEDESADDAPAKKGAPFNPALEQPDYMYSKRWGEYR